MVLKKNQNEKGKEKKEEQPLRYRTRFFGFKRKHIAYFLTKSGAIYELQGKRRIRTKGKIIIQYKKKAYLINLGNCSFRAGLKDYYLFDLISSKQLFFEEAQASSVPAEILDLVVNNNFFGAVLRSIGARIGFNFNSIITGLAIGGLIGFVVGTLL